MDFFLRTTVEPRATWRVGRRSRPRSACALPHAVLWSLCSIGGLGCRAQKVGEEVAADAGAETGMMDDLGGPTLSAPRRLITADWLDRRVTVLDYDDFVLQGQSRAEALISEIDLSAYAPGPLELAVTPDGRRAVIAVGPGFFQGGGGACAPD